MNEPNSVSISRVRNVAVADIGGRLARDSRPTARTPTATGVLPTPKSWANLRSFHTPSGMLIKQVDASTMPLTCPLVLEVARVSAVLATAYVAAYSVHTTPKGREKTKRLGCLIASTRFRPRHFTIGRLVDDCSTIVLCNRVSTNLSVMSAVNRPVDDGYHRRYKNRRGRCRDYIPSQVSPKTTSDCLPLIQDRLFLLHIQGSRFE